MKNGAFFLTGFNKQFLHLLLNPLFTLFYIPVNRYVMLPKLGSGREYTDMDGNLVTEYFSANTLSKILFYVLFLTTLALSVMRCKKLHKGKRILFLCICIAVDFCNFCCFS